MIDPGPRCVACDRDSNTVPLLSLDYRGKTVRICPEHLPILIHDPGRLVGRLEGAESLRPADTHD